MYPKLFHRYTSNSVNARRADERDASNSADSTCPENPNVPSGEGHNGADMVADGVVNTRVGLLYTLDDLDVFSSNVCETKWIGHLESSLND